MLRASTTATSGLRLAAMIAAISSTVSSGATTGSGRLVLRHQVAHRAVGQRLAHPVGEVLVEHPRQRRVVLDVARDQHPQHLRARQDRDRVVVLVHDDQPGPVVLGEQPGGVHGAGVHRDRGVRRRELVCLHRDEGRPD